MKIEIFGNTIDGKIRNHNEDSFVFCQNIDNPEFIFSPRDAQSFKIENFGSLMCVADGMGGTNAGEVASHESVNFIKRYFSDKTNFVGKENKDVLIDAIKKTNDHLVDYVKTHPESEGMGTTLVLSLIKNDELSVAWIGDSRCYIVNANDEKYLYPFTDDHSMVWELVQQKQMTAEQARVHPQSNIITQSLGDSVSKPIPSFKSTTLREGDKVILCSDGLNGMLSDCNIDAIGRENTDAKQLCNKLIDEANKAGGEDNITVIVSKILKVDNPDNLINTLAGNTSRIINDKPINTNRFLIPGISTIIGIILGLLLGYFIFSSTNEEQISGEGIIEEKTEGPTIDSTSGNVEKGINDGDTASSTQPLPPIKGKVSSPKTKSTSEIPKDRTEHAKKEKVNGSPKNENLNKEDTLKEAKERVTKITSPIVMPEDNKPNDSI